MIACSLLPAIATQAAGLGDHLRRASLAVRCIVPPRVDATVVYQATQIAISPADVERGYVDAPSASKLAVTSNDARGFTVRFSPRLPIFRSVQVRGSGARGEIGPDGGAMIERPTSRSTPTEITYRFVLDARVRPGIYPWPLALSVRPL